jgi:Zn-dependent peptidase ImmA (M78 family)
MSAKFARNKAEELLRKFQVVTAPVDIESVAKSLGVPVVLKTLGDGVSGLLITNPRGTTICVNRDHPRVRRRFTIAHEVGHYFLGHQFEAGEHVHVDEGNYISARGPRSATGVDPKEVEANQFAAALLMPSELVRQQATKFRIGSGLLDVHVSQLAERFQVSEQAMTIRLDALGLL